jgi:uncharacterized protein with HEPN domain
MKPETAKRLRDARKYASDIESFTAGKAAADFFEDRGLQLAVHKLLEIVGEALDAAKESEVGIASQVADFDRYVALRKHLIYEYDLVDNAVIWDIVQRDIPVLISALDGLLGDEPASMPGRSS